MKKKLAQIFHFDLYGKRENKYTFLKENSIKNIKWNDLDYSAPNYFFVKKDFTGSKDFENFIELRILFKENSMGIATGNDDNLVSFNKDLIQNKFNKSNMFYYRPFDKRFTIFDNSILQRARYKLMSNLLNENNIALNVVRQSKSKGLETLVTNNLTNRDFITNHTYTFPLYLYSDENEQQSLDDTQERRPNLNMDIVNKISENLGLIYSPNPKNISQSGKDILLNLSKSNQNIYVPKSNHSLLHPIDILDYIYAVLHSPIYRETYKEFLKIDFPRVPYPKDKDTFWKLVALGGEIRQIHLLESPKVEEYITQYPISGDNKVVIKPTFKNSPHEEEWQTKSDEVVGKVYINETQYFDNVPEIAWNFYIGGYQPAQKWLKDRKDRTLDFDDILHYQKIIVALFETHRLMIEIDKIGVV
jgi:predicted helicase